MNLLAPASLAFLVVAAPIVAMYILKMRRPARVVPSTFLWEPILRDVQANAPWQRLRRNILLLLQLLAVLALAFALARPYVLRAAPAVGDVVAVLDASALMSATDVAPSRFAAAKSRIGSLVDGLAPGDVMSIVLMARRPRILIAQSSDHSALHAALDSATPTEEQPDPSAAIEVADALARGSHRANIFVYTAAGASPPAPPADIAARTHVIALGGNFRDLGIVSFAASRAADGTVSVLTRVANIGRRPVEANVQLDAATGKPGQLTWHDQVDLHPVSLGPGASAVITRMGLPSDVVAVRTQLLGGDDLASDDRAWAAVPSPQTRRVLLVTPGGESTHDVFLRLALSLAPNVALQTIAPDQYTPGRARDADLLVLDGWVPSRLPPTSILMIGPPLGQVASLGLQVGQPITAGVLQSGDDQFNLFCPTCLTGVGLYKVSPLNNPAWAYPVLRTGGHVAMVAGQLSAQRVAVLGFTIFDTNWPLLTGFPVVIQNMLDWLAPPLSIPIGTYRPGDALPLPVASGAATIAVVDPTGRRTVIGQATQDQQAVNASLPGLYTIEQSLPGKIRRALVAVNAFAPTHGVTSATAMPAGRNAAQAGKAEVPVELAPLIAALALLVLGGEWWLSARRK